MGFRRTLTLIRGLPSDAAFSAVMRMEFERKERAKKTASNIRKTFGGVGHIHYVPPK